MNIVHNADCMDGMRSFPDKHFDLAVVDPPYGVGASKMKMGETKSSITIYEKKNWDDKIPDESYFIELERISYNQIIFGANYYTQYIKPTNAWICWDKKQPVKNSFSMFELAWTSFDKKAMLFSFFSSHVTQGKRIHPTQKPVKLYDWIFTHYAKPGMKILDTHVGSGSSRIAADKHRLDFIGYELDPDYWAAQEKRFTDYKSQLTLWT